MESYFPSKLKRKDLENVNDDFSEFSLSSPARKIRRLDADLPPIIEEEDCEIPPVFDPSYLHEQRFDYNLSGGIKIEELPDELSNEERAIVLFKPVNNTPLVHSPSDFSVSMSPELLAGLKRNQLLRSNHTNSWRLADDEAVENCSSNGCRAVVPWVPSQNCSASELVSGFSSQINNIGMMEEEEVAEASKMDIEDGNEMMEQGNVNGSGGMSFTEGLNQWQQQQQHCFIPQPPHQNANAPIVWYR